MRTAFLVSALLLGATMATAATQRRVKGIITAVEGPSMTITPTGKKTVTGRLDPQRTQVIIDGHAARVGDLKVTYDAKAELALDDVWISVRARAQ